MIASLAGTVAQVSAASVVLEVGGVGLAVSCTPQTAASVRVGEPLRLHTSLVVREDSLTLYGFTDAEQRETFQAVQTVSGIGPRTALAVLATLSPQDLRRAIASEDVATLTKVPGIGTKGAQRMVIELRDRLGAAAMVGAEPAWQETVTEALTSLGWSPKDADAAVVAVGESVGDDAIDMGALLRAALQYLDRR